MRFITVEQVAQEVRYVRRGGCGPDAAEREAVDLHIYRSSGLLSVVALESPVELATFVDFALQVDDGEAAACALAIHRGGILISDDRKARRVLSQRSPQTPSLTTAEVLNDWVDRTGLKSDDVARLLRDIEERATFRPRRQDPLGTWWESYRVRGP